MSFCSTSKKRSESNFEALQGDEKSLDPSGVFTTQSNIYDGSFFRKTLSQLFNRILKIPLEPALLMTVGFWQRGSTVDIFPAASEIRPATVTKQIYLSKQQNNSKCYLGKNPSELNYITKVMQYENPTLKRISQEEIS